MDNHGKSASPELKPESSPEAAATKAARDDARRAETAIGDIAAAAHDKADDLKSEAARIYEDGKEKAARLATDAYENARTEAESRIGDARAQAAEDAENFAQLLRDVAARTRNGSIQSQALGHVADMVANASDAIRDKSLSEVARDVTAYARQRPAVFLGAAALIGFALTRFAKASDPAGTGHDRARG